MTIFCWWYSQKTPRLDWVGEARFWTQDYLTDDPSLKHLSRKDRQLPVLSTKYAHICLAYKWLRQNSSAFYPASTCLRHVSWASIIILTVFPGHKLVCYQPSSIGYGMQLATIAGPLYGLLCAFACSFISKHIRSPINFVGFRQKSSILGSIFFWYLWALGMVHTAKVYSHSAWVGS